MMSNENMNLEQLLNALGLSEYYPEKLSRDELYQLTNTTLKTDEKEDVPLAWQFIQDIVRYNYNARNVKNKLVSVQDISMPGFRQRRANKQTVINSCIHPLDIIVSVFLCSAPTARQDLVMHMWACRLAVPFILPPNENKFISVYLWPLRSLIGQVNDKNEFLDRPLIKEAMDCIGFVRVGENDAWSKSYLLDCLIWGPDKTHSTFIHRDSEGSKRTRSCIVDGLVEIAWYLPSGELEDRFADPKLLLNLRGDARKHYDQTKIIGQLASMTIVLTTVKELSSSVSVVKNFIEQNSRVIILLSDRNVNTEQLSTIVDGLFWEFPDDELDFLELEQKRLPEVLKFIQDNFKRMEKNTNQKIVMSDFVKNISSMTAFVDETDKMYKEAFEFAKDILVEILKIDEDSRKSTLFPLQENYWKRWAQKERDYHRFHQLDDNKRRLLHVDNQEQLEAQMAKIRSDQYTYISRNGISKPIDLFIRTLASFDSGGSSAYVKRKVFLRFLKLELDDISRHQLVPLNRNYQELINESAGAREDEKKEINRKLSELDAVKCIMSFGLENVFRELGQIYEACEIESRKKELRVSDKQESLHQYKKLPKYMCYILKDGYPFELLDGEARSIPPKWTKAVLGELENVLLEDEINDKALSVHVISVLGIQSSGKSTLINVLFGLQFPVSAGRCTRGAFMQLVKVHKNLSADLGKNIDYVLVIDTEGLRTAALSSMESLKHDNELSTFVIGLAHTTVINLMGENATYLQENLPIVVQAFLRMYLVHLHPRCTIVHHNVDKRNREKMLQQGLTLQSVLDKLTKRACETEKVPQKTFRDIIAFDVVEHTCYIPSLLEGVLPMAPVSLGYSSEAECTRVKLIQFLKQENVQNVSCQYSFQSFSDHLFKLWNAILKDNFLYEFRTTTEVALRLEIDRNYLKILLQLTEDVNKNVSEKTKKIKSGNSDSISSIYELDTDLKKTIKRHQDTFESFFQDQKKTTPYLPDVWRSDYIDCLKGKYDKLLDEAKTQIRDYETNIMSQSTMTKQEIKDFICRCQEVSFDQAWKELKPNISEASKNDFLFDAVEALKDVCFSARHLLQLDDVNKKRILSDFKISDDKHINHPFEKFTDLKIARLRGIMNEILRTVFDEYESEIKNIKHQNRTLSYSSRIPKRILLRVEKNLSARLQSDDSLHGISNQFKIDLLSCVAMSCVLDMQRIFKRGNDVAAEYLRFYLRSCIFSENKLENSLSMAIFELIDENISHYFSDKIVFLMLDGMQRSIYQQAVSSKRSLIGSCIKYFIENAEEDMMIEYIRYPKSAVKQYLTKLVNSYISEAFLQYDFQFYIRCAIDNVWRAFEKVGNTQETSASLKEVLKAFLAETDLPSVIKNTAYIKFKRLVQHSETFDFKMLKDTMLHYVEGFIDKEVSTLRLPILEKQDEYASVLADGMTERLIGCLARCESCKEICLLAEDHGSSHIYLHRLTNNNDFYHRPEIISCLWKWLVYHKNGILTTEHLQMVNCLPEEWKCITKKEVVNEIEDKFGIEKT